VKLLGRSLDCSVFQSIRCIELTLDKPSPDDVSPITIDRHWVHIQGDLPTHDDFGFCHEYYDISDDGYARGLFLVEHSSCCVAKFTIDATQDRCVAVLSQFSESAWDDIMSPINAFSPDHVSLLLDGVRGRLFCCVNSDDSDGPAQSIVVVDIE